MFPNKSYPALLVRNRQYLIKTNGHRVARLAFGSYNLNSVCSDANVFFQPQPGRPFVYCGFFWRTEWLTKKATLSSTA